MRVIGSWKGKDSSRRLGWGKVAVVTCRGREAEGGVLIFLITCENELDELSSGLKGLLPDCRGMDWRRDVGVGMEVDIRFATVKGTGVAFGERVIPFGFRVVTLALLLLLSREALDRPLVFVLTEGEGMDMREVEVLRDSLVDASDGVAFFVLAIGSQLRNEDRF